MGTYIGYICAGRHFCVATLTLYTLYRVVTTAMSYIVPVARYTEPV